MSTMNVEDMQAQRPKLERRLDAAVSTLERLVKNLPGGDQAIMELKNSMLALEIQHGVELELISLGRVALAGGAVTPEPAGPVVIDDSEL